MHHINNIQCHAVASSDIIVFVAKIIKKERGNVSDSD